MNGFLYASISLYFHLVITITLRRYHHYHCFLNEKVEAQNRKV